MTKSFVLSLVASCGLIVVCANTAAIETVQLNNWKLEEFKTGIVMDEESPQPNFNEKLAGRYNIGKSLSKSRTGNYGYGRPPVKRTPPEQRKVIPHTKKAKKVKRWPSAKYGICLTDQLSVSRNGRSKSGMIKVHNNCRKKVKWALCVRVKNTNSGHTDWTAGYLKEPLAAKRWENHSVKLRTDQHLDYTIWDCAGMGCIATTLPDCR